MDNNLIKNEANINLSKTENQNENQTVILTKKFKNTGILTINEIYSSASSDYEKLKLIESEYIKLQNDFYGLKKEFIQYIETNQWSEVIVKLTSMPKITKFLKENNIKYKTKILNNSNWLKLLVQGENLENFWKNNYLF